MTKYLLLFLITTFAHSSEIIGDWHGQLDIMGTKLRLVFHINKVDGTYNSTLDSPDQGAFDLPVTSTVYENNKLTVTMDNLSAVYVGQFNDGGFKGTFTQRGMDFPLALTTQEIAKPQPIVRPQDPIKPYPYDSEDIIFINKSAKSIKLAGTLTLPKGIKQPPVAVLITGSGPQNRNEELAPFHHRPFLVLSDYLTNNGIAVLRFDDRGVGQSEGEFKGATSADFATDVAAAVDYLKTRPEVDHNKIGLIGHSEGGLIAPMLASSRSDIAFIVLLAGTGVDGATILTTQSRRAAELAGASPEKLDFDEKLSQKVFALVKKAEATKTLKLQLTQLIKQTVENGPKEMVAEYTEDVIKNQIDMLSSNWFQYFIKTDPKSFLIKVRVPVLALNGEKDFQVLPELNLKAIEKSLKIAKNKDYTVLELDDLNHLFQTAKTGALSEYGKIEETMSPKALKIIAEWINKRFR